MGKRAWICREILSVMIVSTNRPQPMNHAAGMQEDCPISQVTTLNRSIRLIAEFNPQTKDTHNILNTYQNFLLSYGILSNSFLDYGLIIIRSNLCTDYHEMT